MRVQPNIRSAAGLNSRMLQVLIGRDDGVVRGFENGALARFAFDA